MEPLHIIATIHDGEVFLRGKMLGLDFDIPLERGKIEHIRDLLAGQEPGNVQLAPHVSVLCNPHTGALLLKIESGGTTRQEIVPPQTVQGLLRELPQ